MFKSALSLSVPMDNTVRDNIRKKVELYFATHKTVPPVSYDRLSEQADQLIADNNWKPGFKAFVMVCSGNAIWRSIVGAVPFNRRMLLLPQCLRNSTLCRAGHDEIGLLCSECGNCEIADFLSEAETLGYITAVTEGTTIATKLLESGRVDAIVGVGCMEVLQKMFVSVNKYSVPAIGVPLLTCGCVNTSADSDWIREEINYKDNKSELKILNINNLKDKTQDLFTKDKITKLLHLNGSLTDQLVLETLLAGGKRIRPLFTVLAYEAFCKDPDPGVLQHLSLSVECFHKASLIHDDIEDNDSSRYGKETLHTRFGVPVAINLGDLLIGEGYRLIAESQLPSHVATACLKIVSQGHKALSIGQGNELMARVNNTFLSLDEILDIFENKTAAAFRVSLLLGAVAGGADTKTISLLDHFSQLMGLAFQLKDDLEDFTVENGFTAFENPSVLISMLAEKVSDEDRLLMQEALLNNHTEGLQMLMNQYKVREMITGLLHEYLQQIDTCLGDLQNIGLKLALHEIVGKTFRNHL
jgi:geranylgeranyl diphosphate synthase, type II